MIEVYAFLAMFAVQILAMSVLFPARIIKYSREANYGHFRGTTHAVVSGSRSRSGKRAVFHSYARGKRGCRGCRPVRAGLAVQLHAATGLEPGYGDRTELGVFRPAVPAAAARRLVHLRLYKAHEHALSESKRTAMLERRRLFDFVSPSLVFLAVLAYLLFVALVIIFQRESFPGFFLVGVLTLVYALQARDVYRALYGKKHGPLDTHTVRANRTGFAVKFGIYICIVNAVFFAFAFLIDLLDQKKWVPFAMSVLFVTVTLLINTGFTAMLRKSKTSEVQS